MFFDEAPQKKPVLKPKLRLAGEVYSSGDEYAAASNPSISARQRLEEACARRENDGTSWLDRIDAMSHEAEIREVTEQRPALREQNSSYAPHESDVGNRDYGNFSQQNSNANGPLVHPIYVFNAIRKWRNVIAATTILGGLIGLGIAATTPKLYFSQTQILIDPRNYKVIENDINPDVFLSEAALAIVDSQVNIIRSPSVVDKVVSKLRLEKDAEFNGERAGLLSTLKGFFSIISGENSDGAKVGMAIRNLNKKSKAEREAGTFIVNIGAYSETPQKAADIANTFVEVYLQERADDRTDTADRTSGAMEARLPELKKQVEAAESKAAKFKAENDLFDAQGRLIDDEEILRLNDQLTAARSTTFTLNARADSAKSVTVDDLLAGGLPEEINSNALNALRAQYTTAKQRFDGLESKLGPMHPDLQQAGNESASLRASIDAEIKRIRSSLQTDLRRAVQTEQSLAARLAQLKAKLAQSGDALVKLREIEREAASARTVYEQFLLRAQETGEQGTIDSTNVKQTNPAKPAAEAEGTSKKIIVLGGLIGGLIFGLGLAILKGIFDALKVQYGGSLSGAMPSNNSPRGRPNAPTGTKRGTFQPAVALPTSHAMARESYPLQGATAQAMPANFADQPMQSNYQQPPQMQPAPMLQPQIQQPQIQQPIAPQQYAPVQQMPIQQMQHHAPQPQYFPYPVAVQQPMPVPPYYQQMQQTMPQVWGMPPMMAQPQMWQQPVFVPAPMQQPHYVPVPMQAAPQATTPVFVQTPEPVAPAAPAQETFAAPPRTKTLPENPHVDDIRESLADMRAELLNLANHRRRA